MGKTHRDTGSRSGHARALPGMPFVLTLHAVEQFHARIAPGLSFAKARTELKIIAQTARRSTDRTARGDELWVATDGDPFVFVVKVEQGARLRTCMTVLASDQCKENPR